MRDFQGFTFSRHQLLLFILAFGAIGSLIYLSFAAPNPNLQGDLNNDNVVDVSDLSILASNYKTNSASADINSDGIVSIADLSILLSHYGQTYSGGGISVALPAAPQSYTIPVGAVLVSTSAQLKTALSNGTPIIELADGTYTDTTYFSDSNSSSLYAQNVGKAIFTTGLVDGGNFGPGGSVIRGLAFNITNNSLGFQGAALNLWGPSAENATITDCTFEGNMVMGDGILDYHPNGLIAQRLVFKDFIGDGFSVTDNTPVSYGSSTAVINTISDINVDNVSASPPGSSNGTAEAGLWVGNPVTNGVRRIKVSRVLWSGIWTGNNSWNTTFSDLTVDESGMSVGIAIYIEHYTYRNTFTNFNITGANTGINSEWDDGTAGNAAGHFNTIQNGTIDATGSTSTGNTAGIFLDAGTESTTVTGVTFKNQSWAGIGAYLNIGTNSYSNNTYQLKPGAVNTTTSHI